MSKDQADELLYLADMLTTRLLKTRWRYDPMTCDLRRAVENAYAEQSRARANRLTDEQLARLIEDVREA